MSHVISGRSKARFQANKKLRVVGRYLHISVGARMIENPCSGTSGFVGPALVPKVDKPGVTYKADRRAFKMARAVAKATRRRFRPLSA